MCGDNRKHDRVYSLNLLDFVCIDKDNRRMPIRGMGRTLNVSHGGITLETHIEITSPFIELNIGLEDEIIEIKGKIIYCKPNENNKFATGIEFITTDSAMQKLSLYIDAFNKQQ